MIGIETRLRKYAEIVEDNLDRNKLKVVLQQLEQLGKDVRSGPMRKVFEACGGKDVHTSQPPTRPTLQLMRLRALCLAKLVEETGDTSYNDAVQVCKEAIVYADTDRSRYLGSRIRLDLCRLLMTWNALDGVRAKVLPLLDRVITENIDPSLSNEAIHLKEKCDGKKEMEEVLKAMNVIDGYNYGGAWSSHWFECP